MFVNNFFKILALNNILGQTKYNDYGECLAINGASRRVCGYSRGFVGLYDSMANMRTSSGSYGVYFGNGTEPVKGRDYKLSGSIISTLTTTYKHTFTPDETGFTYSTLYTLTNTSSTNNVTISEVGLVASAYYRDSSSSTNSYTDAFLIERTLLDTPITLAPNGVGQVTYTIRINYPVL